MADVSDQGTLLDLDVLLADELFADDLGDVFLPGDAFGLASPASRCALDVPTSQVARAAIKSGDAHSPPSKRVPWKDRRKEEITYLQQRVRELEFQLRSLETSTGGRQRATEGCETRKMLDLSWKSIARRQLGKRQRSEAENAQLKRAVTEYVMAAQRLQDLVYRRHRESTPASVLSTFKEQLAWTSNDVVTARQLIREVEEQYKRVDLGLLQQILRSQHHQGEWREGFDFASTVAYPGGTVLYFDLPSANMVPFPFHRVCDAAWAAVKALFSHDRGHPLDSEAFRAVVKLPLYYSSGFSNGSASDVVGSSLLVIQRFIENGRMVLVWRCIDRSAGPSVCIASDVTGWCVLEPVPMMPGAAHAVGTCVRGSACAIPAISRLDIPERSEEVHQVARKLAEGLSNDFKALKDMMEDSLLQESMRYDKKAEGG